MSDATSSVDTPNGTRTDLCDRESNVIDGFIPIEQGLVNVTLRIAVANTADMTVDPDTGTPVDGLMTLLLNEIERRAGFNSTYIWVDATSSSQNWDKRFKKILPYVDILVAESYTDTARRRRDGYDFLYKLVDTSSILITSKASTSSSSQFFSFLAPLSYYLWIAILIAVVVNGLALWSYGKKKGSPNLSTQLYLSFCQLTFVETIEPEGAYAKILNIGYSTFALILYSAYTAAYSSLLLGAKYLLTRFFPSAFVS
jgi:hypothetical protein